MPDLTRLRDSLRQAVTLLVPVRCAGCGRPDFAVCQPCRHALREQCDPVIEAVSGVPLAVAAHYGEPLSSLLSALKEHGRADAAKPLAGLLRVALAALQLPADAQPLLVPIPSRRSAVARRGFDHLALIAQHAGLRPSLTLRHTRRVRDQAGLGTSARAENLCGALAAHPHIKGRAIVLFDDVRTSGATLAEAIRAAQAADACVLGAAVLAGVDLRLPHRGSSHRGDSQPSRSPNQ